MSHTLAGGAPSLRAAASSPPPTLRRLRLGASLECPHRLPPSARRSVNAVMMMLTSAILALAASAAGQEKPGHELLFADIPADVCWSQTDCEPAVKVFKDGTVMLGLYHFFWGGTTHALMGMYNKAVAGSTHTAMGMWNTVMAGSTHTAMGMWNTVMGGMAHTVMGWNNTIMGGTAATVMGYKTVATGGMAQTAMGYETNAIGMASLSTGYKTAAFDMAVSMGNGTLAKGISSVSMGPKTQAESFAEVVIGQFNERNPIGECDQFGPGKPYPGPAPEGCASRGWPERLEGFEMDINGTMVTKKLEATEKKLEATEKKLAALEAAVMALTRNP
ncbi:hypothetical protein EMIHUDRAFT_97616 [Emiliania huxleyi CCMP1516]|uniref:Uncharacterized protein n=2 Tax=Emiliania huxleyi TaxID=2903 RepID=A0A0D3L075_EMIH1|nr:hypothetical protein EMIHUDRAFT_97616 [Emiliania huxleyi CCMP1516]EOD41410.1 hypothetical protein EMIHUDRAFT_97616 [Emiliania huxleyi CCMP1516]|eukprot:XP_005793839.1 hypothetical protein EMIHUDRAFT_97616 [Emiliania huxleyi CCMP1516]